MIKSSKQKSPINKEQFSPKAKSQSRTHWKGAKSLQMQKEASTIINPIEDDMENLMGII